MDRVRVTRLCCSDKHSLVCTNTGAVFAWGQNDFGQLGIQNGPKLNKAGAPVAGLFSSTPKKVIGLDKQFIHDVACGDNHSLALDNNRDVFAWGSNLEGQLGIDMSVCTALSLPRKLILYEFMNSSNREHFITI